MKTYILGWNSVHGCCIYGTAPHIPFCLSELSSLELALIRGMGGAEGLCGDRNKILD